MKPARPFGRVYSFRDVVGLRTLAKLRRKVSLQQLRNVAAWLQKKLPVVNQPWSSLRFYIAGDQVVFDDPTSGRLLSDQPLGQVVLPVDLVEIRADMERRAERLRARAPRDQGRVARNRYVAHNAWVVAGTRVPTAAIWDFHDAGYTVADIIREYPQLTPKDVRGALKHEARRSRKKAS